MITLLLFVTLGILIGCRQEMAEVIAAVMERFSK
jgi:hypothetical protein